jgi:hypothetical protein
MLFSTEIIYDPQSPQNFDDCRWMVDTRSRKDQICNKPSSLVAMEKTGPNKTGVTGSHPTKVCETVAILPLRRQMR